MTDNTGVNHLHHAVVVGVDGSPASWLAVRAAAWEAQQRTQDLVLVHGFYERMPYLSYGMSLYVPTVDDVLEWPRKMLADTASRVGELYPDLTVHTQLLAGGGAGALIALSRTASLVVVGSRGDGGFAGLSIGSVAAQTAAHAQGPVLVIRTPGQGDEQAAGPDEPAVDVPKAGPVLVGISGSPHDEAAVRFAFEEAGLRRTAVVAVHVWWFPPEVSLHPELVNPYDTAALADQAERLIAETMAGWSGKYPDVPVERRTIHALNPSWALIEESRTAGLVVVGCRGRGGFAGLVLGSVSRDLVGHALAPVAVVHNHAKVNPTGTE